MHYETKRGKTEPYNSNSVLLCELPSSALVNSFCHENVQASDSKWHIINGA